MKFATVESCVEPATSAMQNTINSIAGSANAAIMTSRLEPMPPKLVPTSIPASARKKRAVPRSAMMAMRSEEHTSELQSRQYLVCRLLLEKKKKINNQNKQQLHQTKK